MAVRRQSRSKSMIRSVDSAKANSSSTESKDTPPTGRVSASCPMIWRSASRTMGWNTARTSLHEIRRESSSRRSVCTPWRSTRLLSMASATACWMARSLRTTGSFGMRAWPAERTSVRRTEVGGARSMRARSAESSRSRRAELESSVPAVKTRKRSERTVWRHTTSCGVSSPAACSEASTAANSRTAPS